MVNYRYIRARYKPKIFKSKRDIQEGIWIPLSIAGHISGYSSQNLRLLCYQGLIKSGQFEVGPLLIELSSVDDYILKR